MVYFLSEYFEPDPQLFPSSYIAETISVARQNGEEDTAVKISIPIPSGSSYTEPISFAIPVLLKEEFQKPGPGGSYPLSRQISLKEGDGGQGVFLIREDTGDILAQTPMVYLETRQASSGFALTVRPQLENPKGGERLTYEILLKNTGETSLTEIQLQNTFSQGGLSLVWEPGENLTDLGGGQGAVLSLLESKEERILYAYVDLPESQETSFINTFYAVCRNPADPQDLLESQAQVQTAVTPLKAEFTVEKTADRTTAVPGETIYYQICIRNTGERTLHSVLSTERFLSSNIQAQFLEKAGVELNASKTQALIPQILPGEAFSLEASVTLPANMVSQELVNQVIVVSRETGLQSVNAGAAIQVQTPRITPTPTPWPTQYSYQGTMSKNAGSLAKQTSSYPKTGDETPVSFWWGICGTALLLLLTLSWVYKAKRKH